MVGGHDERILMNGLIPSHQDPEQGPAGRHSCTAAASGLRVTYQCCAKQAIRTTDKIDLKQSEIGFRRFLSKSGYILFLPALIRITPA